MAANDGDRDGDSVSEILRSQANHDAWYVANIKPAPRLLVLGPLAERYITGCIDCWRGTPVATR